MTKVHKILWIEDDALFDLNIMAAPVHTSMKYKLVIARNVTEAVDNILKNEYDVVIVDMRLPPGSDKQWGELFTNARANIEQNLGNKLGLQLLYTLLGVGDDRVIKISVPAWVNAKKFAVFTVEEYTSLERHLTKLAVTLHVKKRAGLSRRTLLDLIKKVLENNVEVVTPSLNGSSEGAPDPTLSGASTNGVSPGKSGLSH